MTRRHTFLRRTGFLFSLLMAGCSTDPTSPFWASATLDTAIGRWRDARVTHYSFRSTVSCFCSLEFVMPKRVTVRDGRVTAVVDIATGVSHPTEWRQSIDSVFTLVRREIRERPERLEVTYDRQLGYPRTLTYGTPENDGGGYITVDSVQVIP
jgi:Family of unknown function (DUF6174)